MGFLWRVKVLCTWIFSNGNGREESLGIVKVAGIRIYVIVHLL